MPFPPLRVISRLAVCTPFLIAFALFFSSSLYALNHHSTEEIFPEDKWRIFRPAEPDTVQIRTELVNILGSYLGPAQFDLKTLNVIPSGSNYGIEADLSLFSSPVTFEGSTTRTGSIEEFTITFNEGVSFDFGLANKLSGGTFSSLMPVRANKLRAPSTSLSTLYFSSDGSGGVSEARMGFVSAGWDIISGGGVTLEGVEVDFFVTDPGKSTSSIGGEIRGKSTVGGKTVELGSVISSDPSALEFSFALEDIGFGDFRKWALNNGGNSQMAMILPPFLDAMQMTRVEASVRPVEKSLYLSGDTDIGRMEMDFMSEGGSDVQLALQPSSGFSWSSIWDSLSPLDDIGFSNIGMVVASKSADLRLKEASAPEGKVRRGVNFTGKMSVPGKVKDVIKVDQVDFAGHYGKPSTFSLKSVIQFEDANLSDDVRFSNISFGVSMAESRPFLKVGGRLDVDISESEMLGLNGEFKLNIAGVEGIGAFWLEALSRNNSVVSNGSQAEPAEWKEPFGIPGVTIRKLGVSAGVSPASPILLSSLGFAGDMKLGLSSNQSKHIGGKLAMNVSIVDPMGSLVDMKVANLNLKGFIEAFSEMELNGMIADVTRSMGADSTQILVVPRDGSEFLGETYDKGIFMNSNFEIMGLDANMAFGVDPAGPRLTGSGSMESFKLESGDFTFFELGGAKKADGSGYYDRPGIELDMSSSPKFKVNGSVTLLEAMTAEGALEIGSDGLTAFVEGAIGGGILKGSATVQVKDFSNGGIWVEGKLEDNIMETLEKFSEDYANNATKDAKEKLEKLERDLNSSNITTAIGAAAQYSYDMVSALPQGIAAGAAYLTRNTLGEIINLNSIDFAFGLNDQMTTIEAGINGVMFGQPFNTHASFSINATSLDALLKTIAEQIGEQILAGLEKLGKAIYDAIIKEALAFLEDVGEFFIEAGTAVVEWGEYTFTCEDVVAPKNGRAYFVAEGNYHYTVTVKEIQVIEANDNNGLDSDLELYGAIFISMPGIRAQSDPQSNQFFFNRSCDESSQIQREAGQSYLVNGTKHLYFSPEARKGKSFSIKCQLRDSDGLFGNAESDAIHGGKSFSLESIPSNGNIQSYTISCGPSGHRVNVTVEIRSEIVEANIARGKTASMSSQSASARAQLALDGRTDGRHSSSSVAITSKSQNPWWQVDLGLIHSLEEIKIYNSSDSPGRLNSAYVLWGDDPTFGGAPDPVTAACNGRVQLNINSAGNKRIVPSGNIDGRYVRVWLNSNEQLQLAEVVIDGHVSRKVFASAIAEANYSDFWAYEKHLTPKERTQYLHDVIDKQVYQWTYDLCKGGAEVSTQHLLEATKKMQADYQPGIVRNNPASYSIIKILLSFDARPNDEIFDLLVLYGNDENAYYALEKGFVPSAALLEKHMAEGSLAVEMIRRGTPVSDQAVVLAVQKNRIAAMVMVEEQGIIPNDEAFNMALEDSYEPMILAFCKTRIPSDANLTKAAERNSTPIFRTMLEAGAKVTSDGAIIQAVEKNNQEILKLALQHGATPDQVMRVAVSQESFSAIDFALENHGDPDLALPLAAKWGAAGKSEPTFINLVEKYHASPNAALREACAVSKLNYVEIALKYGADPSPYVKEQSDKGNDAITWQLVEYGGNPNDAMMGACTNDKTDLVIFLLRMGADASNPDYLNRAIEKSNPVICRELLQAGADPDVAAKKVFAYHLPPESPRRQIAYMSLEFGANPDGLMGRHAAAGFMEIVQWLLDFGAGPNDGIAGAAGGGHLNIVKLLLDYGGEAELGMKPSVQSGNADVVQLIIDNGGDPVRDEYVIIGAEEVFGGVLQVLLANGANPNAMKKDQSALHIAADVKKESLDAIRALVEGGANLEAVDKKGRTPLLLCVANGRKSLLAAEYLLNAGANVHAIDAKGKGAKKLAKGRKMKKLLEPWLEGEK